MPEMETSKESIKFIEKKLNGNEPSRCVDGRPATESLQGPQMLGGSLHPLVLNAIISNSNFDTEAITEGINKLRKANFAVGVHWGPHKHEDKSDCGFADRLMDILQTAKDNKNEILSRLNGIYNANGINSDSLKDSYDYISIYNSNKIKVTGKELIDLSIGNQASFESLEGDHGEQAAFVNIKENATLDTQNLNRQGKQAFNLDLWSAIAQTKILDNSNTDLARDLSLILYMATEMVLVEQKGKPVLPVILHQ